jgi:8-oxo-dGTP pyrophosphatase MutT (NUDIX family)
MGELGRIGAVSPPESDLGPIGAALAARAPRHEVLPEGARRAAVALVLAPGASAVELLLIRRALRRDDPWSGHMALPGGRAAPGEVDLAATARRETAEETGVELPESALQGGLDDLAPTKRHRPPLVVRPFVFALPARPTVVLNAKEVAYHRWIPLPDFRRGQREEQVEIGGQLVLVPGYRLGADFVWGMTHRILEPFLELALSHEQR